jgi:hypothetical protein
VLIEKAYLLPLLFVTKILKVDVVSDPPEATTRAVMLL